MVCLVVFYTSTYCVSMKNNATLDIYVKNLELSFTRFVPFLKVSVSKSYLKTTVILKYLKIYTLLLGIEL